MKESTRRPARASARAALALWRAFHSSRSEHATLSSILVRHTRLRALLVLALALLACGDGRRTVTGQSDRYSLTVQVRPGEGLAAVSQALAWPSNGVPGARVIAERVLNESTDAPSTDTVISDAQGVAQFAALAMGRYTLRVARTFSVAERERAEKVLQDVDELVGVVRISLTARLSDTARVELARAGGSSLIFSESFPAWPAGPSGNQYYFGGYLEIVNNSDTSIVLAGKLWFDAHRGYIRSNVHPDGCSFFLAIERDPDGVWTRWLFRFPDTAKPLAPGEAIVLAIDAVDHRPFGRAGFFDLSGADFEFLGTRDVDNPLVPNMINVGPQVYAALGHGWGFSGGRQVWGLANSVDVEALPHWKDVVFGGGTYLRVPTGAILDIVRYNWAEPHFFPDVVDCPSPIFGGVDAADAVLLTIQDTLAIHRKVSRTLPNGRVVFQRSRNSAADWITGRGTPGKVP